MALIDELLSRAKGKCEACGAPLRKREPAILSFVDPSAGKRRSVATSILVCRQGCLALEQLSVRDRILTLASRRDQFVCPTPPTPRHSATRPEPKVRSVAPAPIDSLLYYWPPRFSEDTSSLSPAPAPAPAPTTRSKTKRKRKHLKSTAEIADPQPIDAAERTQKVRQFLVAGHQLTYEKLRQILDRLELFEFSPEEVLKLRGLLQEQIDSKRYDGMAVYSGTRGQD